MTLATPRTAARRTTVAIALWTVTVLLAVFFTMMGLPKLLGLGGWAGRFATWGYPPSFVIIVGIAELAGAVMVLIPRLATIGIALLAVTMLGAAATHLLHGETGRILVPLVLFAVLTVVSWARRSEFPSQARR
jgi:putative oxidoreductase